jgi:hypothetical protein
MFPAGDDLPLFSQSAERLEEQSRTLAMRFVVSVANMTADGEEFEGQPLEMSIDDAYKTVTKLIAVARRIRAYETHSEDFRSFK